METGAGTQRHLWPRHPRKWDLRGGLSLAAILLVPVCAAGLAGALIPSFWALIVTAIGVVLSLIAGSQIFGRMGLGVVACVVVALLATIMTAIAAPLAVLEVRGEPVSAVVTGGHRAYRRTEEYTLRDLDGRPIPGVLSESAPGPYVPGDRVEVVVDRDGWLDPVTTDTMSIERPAASAAAGLVLVTVTLSFFFGSRAPRERLDLRMPHGYRDRHRYRRLRRTR